MSHYKATGHPAQGTDRAFVVVAPDWQLQPEGPYRGTQIALWLHMTPDDARDLASQLVLAADSAEGKTVLS